ncbi:MAG: hypothetical protein R3C01_16990, partial [Planctomycetaceae bacterium]
NLTVELLVAPRPGQKWPGHPAETQLNEPSLPLSITQNRPPVAAVTAKMIDPITMAMPMLMRNSMRETKDAFAISVGCITENIQALMASCMITAKQETPSMSGKELASAENTNGLTPLNARITPRFAAKRANDTSMAEPNVGSSNGSLANLLKMLIAIRRKTAPITIPIGSAIANTRKKPAITAFA